MTRMPNRIANGATFTSGQVAKICNVATRTVNSWIDNGRLKGHRVPGSKHRRVHRSDLVEFLHANNISSGRMIGAEMDVVLISADTVLSAELQNAVEDEPSLRLTCAAGGFEAGIKLRSLPVAVVIVDYALPDAAFLVDRIRNEASIGKPIMVGLIDRGQSIDRSGLDITSRKPLDAALLVSQLVKQIGGV